MDTPKAEVSDTTYWRNVANQGRGSAMTQCLHEACDRLDQLEREIAELREALKVADDHLLILYPDGVVDRDFVCTTVRSALLSRHD